MTVRTQIVCAFTAFSAVLLIGLAVGMDEYICNTELAKLSSRLESHVDKIATELEEQEGNPDFPQYDEFLSLHTDGLPEVYFQVFDSLGRALFPKPFMPLQTGHWLGTSTFEFGGGTWQSLSKYADPEKKNSFRILVSAPATIMEEHRTTLHKFLGIGTPFGILLTALISFLIVNNGLRPIREIAFSADTISSQSLSYRVPEPGTNDEVQLLAVRINEMISRLEDAFESQKRFVADASHEIRSPLTVMRAELEHMASSATEEVQPSILTLLDEMTRLVRLTDHLLLLARLDSDEESLASTIIRLDELLPECVAKVKSQADRKSISIKITLNEPVPVFGHPEMCYVIFLNLLDNAIKYSPSHSTIDVTVSTDDEFDLGMVSIADQGSGIPEEYHSRIFERFFRIDPSRNTVQGNGLGLAIVKELLKRQYGTIEVRSNTPSYDSLGAIRQGSTFIVNLWLVESD